jgi:proteasome lid subunit RPN8/RPN11
LIIENFKYEIDESNTIRIWDLNNPNENDAPFFLQPEHPDGTAWPSKTDAEQWAVNFINDLLKPAI